MARLLTVSLPPLLLEDGNLLIPDVLEDFGLHYGPVDDGSSDLRALLVTEEKDLLKRDLGPDLGFEERDKDPVGLRHFVLLTCDFNYGKHRTDFR